MATGGFGILWSHVGAYTFWGFLPLILEFYGHKRGLSLNVPLLSFLVISCGSISCIAGGYLSQRWGSAKVAALALLVSGACCFLSPAFIYLPIWLFLALLFVWGLAVIPDSPQFSTLVAQYAPEHLRGTALTIYNSIGFSISTISLIVVDHVFHSTGFWGGPNAFLLLGIGAILGLPFMVRLITSK
jgi:MFS family permease